MREIGQALDLHGFPAARAQVEGDMRLAGGRMGIQDEASLAFTPDLMEAS